MGRKRTLSFADNFIYFCESGVNHPSSLPCPIFPPLRQKKKKRIQCRDPAEILAEGIHSVYILVIEEFEDTPEQTLAFLLFFSAMLSQTCTDMG